MKRTITMLLALLLCLSLCACASRSAAPAPTEAPVETPPVEATPTQTPAEETAPAETQTPEAPADGAALQTILSDIYERYYPGTAGCSLNAAKYAATLLDYMSQNGEEDAAKTAAAEFAAGHDLSPEYQTPEGVPVDFPTKLRDIYAYVMRLSFGEDMAILDDAGYTPVYSDWTPERADALMESVYEGCGLELPVRFALYYSDEMAERFLSVDIPTDEVNEYAVFGALKSAGLVPMEAELLSFTNDNDGSLTLDIGGAYTAFVGSMGTSGEYMLLGSLVNTYLDAFDADDITLKVDGGWLETGHNLYDYALTRYADNVGEV